jgi:N-acetylmuramoyl-L-alanine amidase
MHAPPPIAPAIHVDPLSYEARLDRRDADAVDLVVIHCTELPDLATARGYGERVQDAERGTGFSGHYYVDRDGRIEQWVDPLRVAHHVRGHNPRSIGIELVNLGRFPDWLDSRHQAMTEPYPDAQLDGLVALLRHLRATFPNLRRIAGHEDLDTGEVPATDDPALRVRRKRDPGVMFPWDRVLAASGFDSREHAPGTL